MAGAYASLVSLMNIIHDLQHHPSPPISLDRHQVDSITKHITSFLEFLESYNPPPSADEEEAADPLEMRIVAAAYAAEDAIETHIVDSIQQQSNYPIDKKLKSKITRLMNFFRVPKKPKNPIDEKLNSINLCRDSLHGVIEEMKSIEKLVEEKKKMALVVHDQVALKKVPSSVARNDTMVGSDGALQKILDKLDGGLRDLQVIPIVGMGGIGKTFLAKTIYAKPHIKDRFDVCAWATISQQYNTREILCELLSQATKTEKEKLSGKSEDVLGPELHKYLFSRRFLIVMDDMWSIDAWDKIQHYFPDKSNGSRVLVTTRLLQLSSQLNSDYSFPMSFLDEASSWDLFSKTVFGDKSCPPELGEIGEKIVDNCRGLPLSIVVVGGLLKNRDDTRASWESIRDNFTSVVNMDNDKHCLRLLKLSYNHLPVYLKPCFLYMGVFEEDKEIRVSMIVKLWVSEGFLKPRNGESLETTARGLLQDLVDRNLILVGELGSTGSIKSYKIHDLLRDLCLKEGQKDGFYHVIGQCNPPPRPQGINTQRRIVIPRNTSEKKVLGDLRTMSNARSIIFERGNYFPPHLNLGLLRTLHVSEYHVDDENPLMFRYVNLRHLAIEARGISSFLRSVSLIWNLHTFIVTIPYKATLLADIWKMPQFRHIEFVNDCLSLPDPPSVVLDDDAVIMENLHTLKGVMNLKCCEGVVKRIPNIKKLKLRYHGLLGTDNNDEHCIGNINSLCGLESLSVSVFEVRESIIYMQKLTFPHTLKKLSLFMNLDFEWDDMLEKIGSLPHLEKLKLWTGRFGKGTWETVEGQFPYLKYLGLFSCYSLEQWTAAEEGLNILPRLEHLRLFGLKMLEKIPSELGSILTLKRIWMTGCGEGAVKSAKEMYDKQVDFEGDQMDSIKKVVPIDTTQNKHKAHMANTNASVVARSETTLEKLAGGQLDCQVIPIVGMGGIGKLFHISAWATISQHYDTQEILCEILSQATNTKKEQHCLRLLKLTWKRLQFRHMEIVDGYLCLPDPPSCDERGGDAVIVMENLHTLKGVSNFKCGESVVKRITNIKRLKLEYKDYIDGDDDVYLLGNIKYLCGLEFLSVKFSYVRRPIALTQHITFLHSIKKLSIWMFIYFEWDDILEKIGTLPLERLVFEELEELKEIPFEIGNIDTLKSIKLDICEEELVNSVKDVR